MKAARLLAGILLAAAAAFPLVSASAPAQDKDEKDCPLCLEQARIKKEYDAGRMPKIEWIDRRLALLEGEYFTNRLGVLEEKEKALVPEVKAGKVGLGDVFETKLETLGLKYALKKCDEKEWKARRQEIVSAYKNWLREQLEAGKLGKEEYEKRVARLGLE